MFINVVIHSDICCERIMSPHADRPIISGPTESSS